MMHLGAKILKHHKNIAIQGGIGVCFLFPSDTRDKHSLCCL